jgi:hypothetical protein
MILSDQFHPVAYLLREKTLDLWQPADIWAFTRKTLIAPWFRTPDLRARSFVTIKIAYSGSSYSVITDIN